MTPVEFRANIGMGFCRRVSLRTLREQIQRDESHGMQVKLLKVACQCSSQFVSGGIVRVPECVRVQFRQIRCSDDLFLVEIVTLFMRFARVQLFCTRQ